MKRLFALAIAAICTLCACSTSSLPEATVSKDMVKRLIPQQARKFDLRINGSQEEGYEIFTENGKVHIWGDCENSVAAGVGHYLREYCHTDVSWYSCDPVEMPAQLPMLEEKVSGKPRVDKRFFLNYCTYGYTMPWFDWQDWERLIDWMALSGVNMPLAITGQESIWLEVWKKYGMSEEQILSYFTGPSHLPWHRMNNIDRWQGPLPMGWVEGQKELQKKILKREREFGMKPVLPAFAGHIPAEIAEMFPEANTSLLSRWGQFDDEYRCTFLSPTDPLYQQIQKDFLEEQTRQFGTDHYYGMDLFNEVEAPSWEPAVLNGMARDAYGSLAAVDPEAIWLQMGWLFYIDQEHWTPEIIEAYLSGVPQDKVVLLDYYCEFQEIWKMTEKFYGQPYIWCYLGNFGGQTMVTGNMQESGDRIEHTLADGGDNVEGIGSTLEGFGCNIAIYEYIMDKAWDNCKDFDSYVESIADRHSGSASEAVRKAWQDIAGKVCVNYSLSCMSNLVCVRPPMDENFALVRGPLDAVAPETYMEIWKNLAAEPSARNAYLNDIANIGRDYLGRIFYDCWKEAMAAYYAGNQEVLSEVSAKMLEILDDMDALACTRKESSLAMWIEKARSFGQTPEEKDYYEKNARTLITVWGGRKGLNDYANRIWGGLVSSFYKPRWEMFLDGLKESLASGKTFDYEAFEKASMAYEWSWIEPSFELPAWECADPVALSQSLIEKYGK